MRILTTGRPVLTRLRTFCASPPWPCDDFPLLVLVGLFARRQGGCRCGAGAVGVGPGLGQVGSDTLSAHLVNRIWRQSRCRVCQAGLRPVLSFDLSVCFVLFVLASLCVNFCPLIVSSFSPLAAGGIVRRAHISCLSSPATEQLANFGRCGPKRLVRRSIS